MSILNSTPLLMGDEGGYQISRSVRLRSNASASFTRTFSTPTDNRKWTLSGWFKLGSTSSVGLQANNGAAATWLGLGDGGITLTKGISGVSIAWNTVTAAIFRDFSAWYHGVWVYDSAQATASNRVKVYINGVQQITSGSYPALNDTSEFNSAIGHTIFNGNIIGAKDGYITETNFIDGQALTPSSFGQINAITGVWQPKKYAGTYGTNGFYLNFSDNSAATAAAIGKDYSGNGNNWTPNNISVTAGVTYDSMIDTPTPYADGGNGRGNYCTLNPVATPFSANVLQGNLGFTNSTLNTYPSIGGTFYITSGKWYYEATPVSASTLAMTFGFTNYPQFVSGATNASAYQIQTGSVGYSSDGSITISGVTVATVSTYTVGDVIGTALNLDAGTAQFYKNGVVQSYAVTGLSGQYVPAFNVAYYNLQTMAANFGQRPFTYTPPTGFKALNTQNLPDATITKGNKHFDATTYTGTGATQSIVNSGAMQPDLVWFKRRSAIENHWLTDAVRGSTKGLYSNDTAAETTRTDQLTSFNSNGFTLGADAAGFTNVNGQTYVGWQWKAGGAAVTNTAGSISSQVSANVSAGFSVVTYTGTGANATVGHGLGVAPKMMIIKSRGGVTDWIIYHSANANTGYVRFTTNAFISDTTVFNSTSPTSTTFALGASAASNPVSPIVAYCWSEIPGYSKFGSYTGNGVVDGPFVYLGFRPRFLMIKSTSAVGNWEMIDTARDPINPDALLLRSNSSAAEINGTPINDILSNGFKPRSTNGNQNDSGVTYIYMAFAENPFKNSLAR